MMKKGIVSFFVFFVPIYLLAQPAKKMVDEALVKKEMAADTSKKGAVKAGGNLSLNLNQQNSSNWVGANEEFALNVGFSADLYLNADWEKSNWNNTLKLNYAWVNNQSQGVRKTADFIDFFSKYSRELKPEGTFSVAALFNVRTQFTSGFDYSIDPRRRTSGFFAPATILLTPGLDWRPNKVFSLFFSPFAARFVVVSNDPLSYSYPNGIRPDGSKENPIYELYGVDSGKTVDAQFGAIASANYKKEVFKNVTYTSRLDLYSNYLAQPENIDIFWTNNIVFKVNKWLGINYQFNIAYDNDFTPEGKTGPRTQFLGILGIGFSGKF
jgi:hypothetical protein